MLAIILAVVDLLIKIVLTERIIGIREENENLGIIDSVIEVDYSLKVTIGYVNLDEEEAEEDLRWAFV